MPRRAAGPKRSHNSRESNMTPSVNDSTNSIEISRFELLCWRVARQLGQKIGDLPPRARRESARLDRRAMLKDKRAMQTQTMQTRPQTSTSRRTAGRARRSPSCTRRATIDSGGADPDPEPERPHLTPSPAAPVHGRQKSQKKYVRTLAGSIDDPRFAAARSDDADGDDYVYSHGPAKKSVCKISPQIIGKFAENGWARSQREADFFLGISVDGHSVARAARAVGVGRTTGYGWLHHAYRRIVEAGQPDGSGVRAEKISGQAWQPARRGRRRERLISRQPRSLRLRHRQYQQMDLLAGGAA